MTKEIKFIINRSEITAGTRGASLGPDAIFAAARSKNSALFSQFDITELPNSNYLLDLPTEHKFAKRIDGLIGVFKQVADEVKTELEEGNFPIVLAADHGSAGGTVAGIKEAFPDKRLGVVWIDAHGDLHTPYTTPSGNMHGMPLSTALGDDNIECKINDVPENTAALWDELKSIGYKGPKVKPEDLVFIAVRDTEPQEDAIMTRLNIKNYTVDEVTMQGTTQIVEKVLKRLEACDIIYVSFDVDSMDPKATSYGTGTPVKNGLMPKQAREILNGLGASPKTVCMEIVEVNPCLDEKMNRMAEVTFELIESLVNTIKK
jgi:arginase